MVYESNRTDELELKNSMFQGLDPSSQMEMIKSMRSKGILGKERPRHKYLRRKWNSARSGWDYAYEDKYGREMARVRPPEKTNKGKWENIFRLHYDTSHGEEKVKIFTEKVKNKIESGANWETIHKIIDSPKGLGVDDIETGNLIRKYWENHNEPRHKKRGISKKAKQYEESLYYYATEDDENDKERIEKLMSQLTEEEKQQAYNNAHANINKILDKNSRLEYIKILEKYNPERLKAGPIDAKIMKAYKRITQVLSEMGAEPSHKYVIEMIRNHIKNTYNNDISSEMIKKVLRK